MAKLKDAAIEFSDLEEYLKSFSDFSFELSVLKMLRSHKIECEHGGHYEDPVTKKSRQFDIRARKTIGNYIVRMAVECKNIRANFPLIISCVPRHEQECFHQVAFVGEPKKHSLDPFSLVSSTHLDTMRSRATVFNIRGNHSIYKAGDPVGKSTAQVGRDSNSNIFSSDAEIYDKWGQCLSSATDLIDRIYWDHVDHKDCLSTVFPFVVVPNERLWVVTYDDDGNLIEGPKMSSNCSCFIDKQYTINAGLSTEQFWLSHVEIVTLDGMEEFVKEYFLKESDTIKIFPVEGIADERLHRSRKI